MRNKVVKKLLMIAMAVTMISGTSLATVYANANPPAEETTTEVVQETSTETTEDTEKKEDTGRVSGESNNSAFSTTGNAQLVDDKENDDTKQFLTIQTKKGNTFYMVIDRSSNTENVYMMSLVDENDLAEFLDETEKSKETEESTVVIPETTPETTPVAEEETEVKKEEKTGMNVKGLGAIVLATILGVAGIAVAAVFVFLPLSTSSLSLLQMYIFSLMTHLFSSEPLLILSLISSVPKVIPPTQLPTAP